MEVGEDVDGADLAMGSGRESQRDAGHRRQECRHQRGNHVASAGSRYKGLFSSGGSDG